ncbi:hypothetical protein SELMODRAFT_442953 [Selaginella moellendorffii]|uniref:Uncharacterized protein SHR2-2 n=1 Tax=Selaginella moellendorffii TaxID=88036 RepID=D8RXE5_SELML|nr:protein SHORT-ROOT [Selaginella moellendorffii]EFJ23425.1 hypothetical protein SELMODRAFT_442953 [Selaginella moellendorffii]|eukprot:XP_002975796.1 protein SHORT-ROOT [Selaginella moellendorffii]
MDHTCKNFFPENENCRAKESKEEEREDLSPLDGNLEVRSSSTPALLNPTHHWAPNLLLECARAVSSKDVSRVQRLMWLLNELSSPYGDFDQRIASSFLQGLFCKITGTGSRCHRILSSAAERGYSFDSTRKMMLKFQEVSPWSTFGHVAANGVILEAAEGESRLHIVDISNTFCTQWPTFLEALATRPEGAPHLRLTTVTTNSEESAAKVMKEIGNRLQKFARLMGVPFEFKALQEPEMERLDAERLEVQPGEALVINCVSSLNRVHKKSCQSPMSLSSGSSSRKKMLATFHGMKPKLVTIVDHQANFASTDFLKSFCEALRFYSLVFESLEESFVRTSNERLMLERIVARNILTIVSCSEDDFEREYSHSQWSRVLKKVGFRPSNFSDDVRDDIRALLKRYKDGWGCLHQSSALFLTWKDQSTVFASAWKPC